MKFRKPPEEKIFIDQEEELGSVLAKIHNIKSAKIVLNIPANSVLTSSLENFHAISREAKYGKKKVVIESTDPEIQEMASAAKLKAINPIYGKDENLVTDVIPPEENHSRSGVKAKAQIDFFSRKKPQRPKPKSKRKLYLPSPKPKIFLPVIVFIGLLGYWLVASVLPKAQISLFLKKEVVSVDDAIAVRADVGSITTEPLIILPGEIISASKNVALEFPASGETSSSQKAGGFVYLYNNYSTRSQVLVARTRIKTPDGKVYRLNKRVVIPGAEKNGGKLTPSRIKVAVTADQPGAEYNLSSPDYSEVWRIPGFKEAGLTKLYNGFYAKPAGPITGGTSGLAKFATKEDVEKAKQKIEAVLKPALTEQVKSVMLPGFVLIDGAQDLEIKYSVDSIAEANGKFKVSAQGVLKNMAIKNNDLIQTIIKKYLPNLGFKPKVVSNTLILDANNVNWGKKLVMVKISGSLTLAPDINSADLKADLLGKGEAALKRAILGIPNLEKVDISLWPFWVKSVPNNPRKVDLIVN